MPVASSTSATSIELLIPRLCVVAELDEDRNFDEVPRLAPPLPDYVSSAVHAKGASLGCVVELAEPQASWRVLDVATGARHTALAFASYIAEVTAADGTEEMLEETRKLAASRRFANITTA